MADRVGQQLGNYRLLRLLGEGGFAEVYLGEQVYLKTRAAIKVLHTRLAQAELESFLSEARTIAGLKHPYIVRVLDFGVEGTTPFLVMDYAPGGTLREHIPKGGRLPLASILPVVRQIADALQYAHDQRLIHRDIKPENMLLDERNQVVLSDFGIATIVQSSHYQHTEGVAGTAAYMAPEQLRGKPRPASDQYSLGIVIYEWLTGARPFQGSFAEIASQHLFEPPPPLREKLPTISPAVEQVVLRALAKDPRERFASVQDFAAAFEQASKMVPPLHPSAPITTAPGSALSGPVQQTSQPQPSRQFAPLRMTPPRPADASTLRRTPPPPAPPLQPTVPAAAPPVFSSMPTKTQAQSSGPMMPPPNFSGGLYGPAAPPAPLPAQPRAKQPWGKWLLVGVLVLVLVSGGLLGLRLAGKGSLGLLGRNSGGSTPATTPTRPALGTIKEFIVPTAKSGLGGITAGPDGNLWFTEEGTIQNGKFIGGNQIGRITPSGIITEFALPTANSGPTGITAGPDGNLWFTEFNGNKIGWISPGP